MKSKPTNTDGAGLTQNSLTRVLSEIRRGQALTEASESLAEVVSGVRQWGRPGELRITLKVRPNPDGETVDIEDDLVMKAPKRPKKSTRFFATEEGELTRENPKQPEMFTPVEGGRSEGVVIAPAAVNA